MAGITSISKKPTYVGRGRPRSERAHRAILDAAGTLMLEGGIAAASMEAIAARAGVSKATIYKWWPSRGAVALEGFLDQVKESIEIPEGMSTREGLTYMIANLSAIMRDPKLAPLMSGVISQAQSDPEIAKALRDQWLTPRRAVSRALLKEAIDKGEIRQDVDPDLALDQIFTPLYHRVIFDLEPYSADAAKKLVDQMFEGISAR